MKDDDNTQEIENTEEDIDTDVPEKSETVEESVLRAASELKGDEPTEETEDSDATSDVEQEDIEVETVEVKSRKDEKTGKFVAAQDGKTIEEVAAPQGWSVDGKEWFNKQPKEAQREFAKAARDYQSHTTKLWQDLNRGAERYEQIDRVVSHYNPYWNKRGLTDVQAIAQLCAAEVELAGPNPIPAIDRILKARGITPEQIAEHRKGGKPSVGGTQNNYTPPELQELTSTVRELNNWRQQSVNAEEGRAIDSIVGELQSVCDEKNQAGQYVWPEMHDSEYRERVKPLVSALKETNPSLSWGEAAKRAIISLRGDLNGSPSHQQPRFSRPANNTTQRARAVSVAGRSRGSTQAQTVDDMKVPRGVEDTVRMAMGLISSRG